MHEKLDLLVADRKEFDSYLYVSLEDALSEVQRRNNDKALAQYIEKSLGVGLPKILRDKKSLVLFRHVATPNHEVARFITATAAIPSHEPVILEYSADRFLSRNESKHSLGKLRFQKGINSRGEPIIETETIIDFGVADNTPLSDVKTNWGEGLVDFHHRLFFTKYPGFKGNVFDLSRWLRDLGDAKAYYKKFLTLFLKDAILFENFMLDKREKSFTRSVIIPAFHEIEEECGLKPLVVALEPTDLEGDKFWLSYPIEYQKSFSRKRVSTFKSLLTRMISW